jgi:hypothetical protein
VKRGTGGSFAGPYALKYESLGLLHLSQSATSLRVPKPILTGREMLTLIESFRNAGRRLWFHRA